MEGLNVFSSTSELGKRGSSGEMEERVHLEEMVKRTLLCVRYMVGGMYVCHYRGVTSGMVSYYLLPEGPRPGRTRFWTSVLRYSRPLEVLGLQ